jgi:hypothetical protein
VWNLVSEGVWEQGGEKIFGTKSGEVIGGWRKLYNEELHNLYSSLNIIKVIRSRKLRWVGHVALMGRSGMHTGFFLLGSQKEIDYWEDLDSVCKIILKWTLEKWFIWFRIGTSDELF